MWGQGPFSRASVTESVRSVVILVAGATVATSGTLVWGWLHFRAPVRHKACFLAFRALGPPGAAEGRGAPGFLNLVPGSETGLQITGLSVGENWDPQACAGVELFAPFRTNLSHLNFQVLILKYK